VKNGQLCFNPGLLRKSEFLEEATVFEYVDVQQEFKQLPLEKGSLCFTYCQVPIVYTLATENRLTITYKNSAPTQLNDLTVDETNSLKMFERTGEIIQINVQIKASILK
jgi:hypothetical protein